MPEFIVTENAIGVPGQPRSSCLPLQVAPLAGKAQVLVDGTCAKGAERRELMPCSRLLHRAACSPPPQPHGCVGTKHNSWFQFCQLPDRSYRPPSRGISHGSARPSRKHRRCAVVLGKKHPLTTTNTKPPLL